MTENRWTLGGGEFGLFFFKLEGTMPDILMIILECCENMFGRLLVIAVFCFLFITPAAKCVTK